MQLSTLLGKSLARQRLMGDAVWVAIGQFAVAVGLLLGTRLLTDRLPPVEFGAVSLLLAASTLGGTLLCTPLLQALLRFYPDAFVANSVADLRKATLVPLRTATFVLMTALAAGGAVYANIRDVSAIPFLVLAALAPIDVARNYETGLLSAARRQKTMALWLAADTWARSLGAIAAVIMLGPTTQSVLLGYLVGSVGVFVIARQSVRREGLLAQAGDEVTGAQWKVEVRRYALPLLPLAIVGWVSSLSDRYIVAGLIGLREAGIYAAAYGLLNRPFAMGGVILMNTLRPVLFQAVAEGNTATEKRLLRMWLLTACAGLAVGVAIITVARRFITHLLLGPEYQGTSELLPWLAFGFSLLALSQIYNTVSLAHKQSWAVTVSEGTGAVASVVAAIPLTMAYGITGTAVAVPTYYAVQLATAWHFSRRRPAS